MTKNKTINCFTEKWKNLTNYGFSEEQREFFARWAISKYGFKSVDELNSFYASKKNILEVGCGSCFNIDYISKVSNANITGIDISFVAVKNGLEIFKDNPNIKIMIGDLMDLPFDDNTFDLIIADGVLHHTESTKDALFAVYNKLARDGHLYVYLYKKMGTIREFTNDAIRDKVKDMTANECIEYCKQFTELGQSLSQFKEKIRIPEVDIIGLPAGDYMVQELFYYGIMKCFWNDRFTFHENNMNNYDWFYPGYAWRQSRGEVESWLSELDCEYQFNDSNPNGLSILLRKK